MKNIELQPQEAMEKIAVGNKNLVFGIPNEVSDDERRVALIPSAVQRIVNQGCRVLVQEGAGIGAMFSDKDYSDAGAEIVATENEVFKADVILKIQSFNELEIKMLHDKQVVMSWMYYQQMNKKYFLDITKNKITAVAYNLIRNNDGQLPMLEAMSEIAGRAAVIAAANYLSNNDLLLGGVAGIPSSEVVIIGAGNAAVSACRTALGMNCSVKVFDDSPARLKRLENIVGQGVNTSVLDTETLFDAVVRADVVVCAKYTESPVSPMFVTEQMVRKMKENAVIVDLGINQGGCCETSKTTSQKNPVFEKHGIIHCCVPNITSKYSRTASVAISNALITKLLSLIKYCGIDNLIRCDTSFAKGVYVYRGKLTNDNVGRKFGMNAQPLELLLPRFYEC